MACQLIIYVVGIKVIAETDAFENNETCNLLLTKILHYTGQMTIDELSVCFLYLTKLSVNMQTDVMTTILERISKIMKNGKYGNNSYVSG